MVTWEHSGKGPVDLNLDDARQLAVDAGFVFAHNEHLPLARQADMQKFFNYFGVTSFSSFRHKFFSYELHPTSAPQATTSSDRPRHEWVTKPAAACSSGVGRGEGQYVGELVDGKRHGLGMLLQQGSLAPIVYIGQFSEGRRNGFGAFLTPRGECFYGFFNDDVMWGPGAYIYPVTEAGHMPPPLPPAPQARQRVRFDGMFNGRPKGRGVLTWSDGERQAGEFEGEGLVGALDEGECAGVMLVAGQNAEAGKRAAAEAQAELVRRGLWAGQLAELWEACARPAVARRRDDTAAPAAAAAPG